VHDTSIHVEIPAVCLPAFQLFISGSRSTPSAVPLLRNPVKHYQLHIALETVEGIPVKSTTQLGLTFGVEMEQMRDPGTFLVHLAHWKPADTHHDEFALSPKPFDITPLLGFYWSDVLHGDDVRHNYLIAKWINDERTVDQRIGFAQTTGDLNRRIGLEYQRRVLYLV
jgi:hypothetical protein